MFTWENFDPADSKIARRSLLAFATGTLVLANVIIVSDQFSFFGLIVEVSQNRLVALGRVLTAIFFVIYLVKELPNFTKTLQNRSSQLLRLKHENESVQLSLMWFDPDGQPYEDGPNGEFKDLADRQKQEDQKLTSRYPWFVSYANLLSAMLTTYFIPFGLAVLAIGFPRSLEKLIDAIIL